MHTKGMAITMLCLFRRDVTMKITVMDASNYFKGLLLLIRKDRKTSDLEIELMRHVGKSLGFEKEFYNNAIEDILENEYIVDEPPKFSTTELAIKFIKDGLSLAFVDNDFHRMEEQWLKHTAEINGLDYKFFSQDLENVRNRKDSLVRLEVDDLSVEYA
jgi:hypothetical protein